MDNPETLATLSIQDTGPENKNEKKTRTNFNFISHLSLLLTFKVLVSI
jgi:hypothetical protein